MQCFIVLIRSQFQPTRRARDKINRARHLSSTPNQKKSDWPDNRPKYHNAVLHWFDSEPISTDATSALRYKHRARQLSLTPNQNKSYWPESRPKYYIAVLRIFGWQGARAGGHCVRGDCLSVFYSHCKTERLKKLARALQNA